MFLKLLSALSYLWNVDEFAPEKFIVTDFDGKIINAWQKSAEQLFDYVQIDIKEKEIFKLQLV